MPANAPVPARCRYSIEGVFLPQPAEAQFHVFDFNSEMIEVCRTPRLAEIKIQTDVTVRHDNGTVRTPESSSLFGSFSSEFEDDS